MTRCVYTRVKHSAVMMMLWGWLCRCGTGKEAGRRDDLPHVS